MNAFPRFMVSAAHKSSGKTVVSAGLTAAFRKAGHDIQAFKKGPDYIDPMWLAAASGRPCYNLDFNVMARDTIAPFFAARARGLSLIEANKGLYDGVCPDGSDSNAEMARLLGLPVVLVIDTRGMTRGIAPLLFGYQEFDPAVKIAGVILNQVGGARHEGKLRRAVETYSDLAVFGSIGRHARLEIGERHLGLTTPVEAGGLEGLIAGITDVIEGSVDLDALLALARTAPGLAVRSGPQMKPDRMGEGLRIGIIRDAAFGFYYPDDLEAFEAAGTELVPIDAIEDRDLPDIDGLIIGGGFPEMQAENLSANSQLRAEIGKRLAAGMPCYAECGGLMYLCESLSWSGRVHPMVGFIHGRAIMHGRPQGRGHVEFRNTDAHPWAGPDKVARAHEFHYASIEGLPPDTVFTRKMIRGAGIGGGKDAIRVANTVAGFSHLRNTPDVPWVGEFLDFVQRCKAGPS